VHEKIVVEPRIFLIDLNVVRSTRAKREASASSARFWFGILGEADRGASGNILACQDFASYNKQEKLDN
jgi:hypothetical protein